MVFVDDMRAPFGRMVMCHMIADTPEELLAMADRIGVQRKWIQKAGTYEEHFDISKVKKEMALRAGAQLVSSRELVAHMHLKRPVTERPTWIAEILGYDEASRD